MTTLGRTFQAWDDGVETLLKRLSAALAAEPHHALTLRFTLILLVLHGATTPFAAVVVRVLGLVMLVLPSMTAHRTMWYAVALTLVISNADQWELIDNHQYLMTYWVLACAVTIGREDYLRLNARLLVAVAFTFAVIWKLIAGQYVDGSFFHLSFLMDGRLQNYAGILVDSGNQGAREASVAIRQLMLHGEDGSTLAIAKDPSLAMAALGMSWAGLALESLVAILHLLPGQRWYVARHVALMMFVAFTYPLLPVTGFGFLLAVMGFAQLNPDDQRLKGCYLGLLCFLQITLIPWRNLLAVPA